MENELINRCSVISSGESSTLSCDLTPELLLTQFPEQTFTDFQKPRNSNMRCQICDEFASGFHLGAFVCEACKKFFIRHSSQDSVALLPCILNGNCDISGDKRSKCQTCRFKRCLKAGMSIRDPIMNNKIDISRIPCRVCGGSSSGFHFGALTCEGCKGFFRRIDKPELHLNSYNKVFNCRLSNNCEIRSSERNSCKACRYKKCIAVGMSREKSKIGRHPNAVKYQCAREINHKTRRMELSSVYSNTHQNVPIRMETDNSFVTVKTENHRSTENNDIRDSVNDSLSSNTSYFVIPKEANSDIVNNNNSNKNNKNIEKDVIDLGSSVSSNGSLGKLDEDTNLSGDFLLQNQLPLTIQNQTKYFQEINIYTSPVPGTNITTSSSVPTFVNGYSNNQVDIPAPIMYSDFSSVTNSGFCIHLPNLKFNIQWPYNKLFASKDKWLYSDRCHAIDKLIAPQDVDVWEVMMFHFYHHTKHIVEFAKSVPGFDKLCVEIRRDIVRNSMYPIMLIYLSKDFSYTQQDYNYFDFNANERSIIFQHFPILQPISIHILKIGSELAPMHLDNCQIVLLCIIELFRNNSHLPDQHIVHQLFESYQKLLLDYQSEQANFNADLGFHCIAVKLPRIFKLFDKFNDEHKCIINNLRATHSYLQFPELYSDMFQINDI